MARRSSTVTAAALLLATAALAGCQGTAAGGGGEAAQALTIGTGGVFTENNNPFAPTSSATANGWAWLIYEPLVQTNSAIPTQEPEPWLASEFAWDESYTSVSFTARDGVTWSDGEPFGAEDIAFTFELIKDDPALNTSNTPFDEVVTEGDVVTVSFDSPQFVNQTAITSQFVVPEHLWSAVEDPSTFADAEPVGTGPFTFASSTSSVARLQKNEAYWQADQVAPTTVVYQALQGNDAIVNALAAHNVDWASSFALNQKTGFTDRDPGNLAWNVSTLGMDAFVLNTAKEPFDDVALRRAINLVLDRERAAELATGGLIAPLTSVTGIPLPVGADFVAGEYRDQDLQRDVEGAKAVLDDAGYELADGVLSTPDGDPVTMTMIDPAGWTDYLTALQVVAENLSEIGISATIETPSADAWNAALASGDFDAAIRYSDSGPTPYDIYATWMDTSQYEPIGTTATGNWSRFSEDRAGEALAEYAAATDEATRTAALEELQRLWVEEVPAIGLMSKASTGMFTSESWQGWPSAEDPYADPGILSRNISQVLTSLTPVSR